MERINLYTGYEKEAEIILREKSLIGDTIFELRMLDLQFDEIINLIPPGVYHPDSVKYHSLKAGEGWFLEEWECKRVQEFYDQLTTIENSVPVVHKNAYDALKQIYASTLLHANKLFLKLD